jgi:hypothetical protein
LFFASIVEFSSKYDIMIFCNMAEKKPTTFERLVSLISEDERKALLDKMRPLEGDPDARVLESEKDPTLDADGIVLEESIKRESIFYRFILWLAG